MLFTIGSRVRLKSTGDSGSVSEVISDGLIRVLLDNGLGSIPVPPEAILPERTEEDPGKAKGGARFVSGKASANQEVAPTELDLAYTILQPWGIQIGFDPVFRTVGDPERYRVYLINDTGKDVIFAVALSLNKQLIWQRIGQLEGTAFFELGDLKHQELNDTASLSLEIRPKLDGGTGTAHRHNLKIKPKQFFKKFITAPLLNRKVYHFTIFPSLENEPPVAAKQLGNLSKLTKQAAREQQRKPSPSLRAVSSIPDPAQLAAFPRSIDLHIEKLLADPNQIPKQQYLYFQLQKASAYLKEAHRLGVDSVFLIHGIGEGKLKAAIAELLKKNPHVASFHNRFHPLYGNGATEVILH